MPRSLLLRSETNAYHVSAYSIEKDGFPLPLVEVWRIALLELFRAHATHLLRVHAFVLVKDRFHLICDTPRANLDHIMRDFLRNMSVAMNVHACTKGPRWDGRHRRTLITGEKNYAQIYRYVYQSPIRAGMVDRVEDYPLSTLNVRTTFPIQYWLPGCSLGWLNQPISTERLQLIELGLRKAQFDVSKRKLRVWEKEWGPKGA
jgi:putative transposase